MTLKSATFCWPTEEAPFYHAVLSATSPGEAKVDWVKVNGIDATFKGAGADGGYSLTVRCNWMSDRPYEFWASAGGKETSLAAAAPQTGGYWNEAWKGCRAVVVTETERLARENEPVEVVLSAYLDEEPKVADWGREVRVFALDSASGELTEVASQTYEESVIAGAGDNPDAKGTTLCRVVFLANVPAKATRLYLVYYANPSAEAPEYASDLSVVRDVPPPDYCHLEWKAREGQVTRNLSVENSFYRILTHPNGQINDITIKGSGFHIPHMEGLRHVIDWNPDVYTQNPKSAWSGIAFGTFVQEGEQAEGPVMFILRRWGEPEDVPGVHIATTYRFYAHNPYFIKESTIYVTEPLSVVLLRNDEFAFPPELFTHMFWKDQSGQVTCIPEEDMVLPTQTPWLGMLNPDAHAGIASLRLLFSTLGPDNKEARLVNSATHFSLAGYVDYWHRMLLSPSGGQQGLVDKGSLYSERNAYLLFEPGTPGEAQLEPVDELYSRLTHPLAVTLGPQSR